MIGLPCPHRPASDQTDTSTGAFTYGVQHAATKRLLNTFEALSGALHETSIAPKNIVKRDIDALDRVGETQQTDLLNALSQAAEDVRSVDRVARCYLLDLETAMRREPIPRSKHHA